VSGPIARTPSNHRILEGTRPAAWQGTHTHHKVQDMQVLQHKVVAAAMHQKQVAMADGDC